MLAQIADFSAKGEFRSLYRLKPEYALLQTQGDNTESASGVGYSGGASAMDLE